MENPAHRASPEPYTPRVGIVIVDYKGRDDTRECLASLSGLTYPDFFVVLVCQPPDVGTAAMARGLGLPWLTVIENPENNGFAGGNNVGIRVALDARADALFLLNNDTTVEPGLLEKLVAPLAADGVGVTGPTMLYYSKPDTIWAAGGVTDRLGGVRHRRMDEPEGTNHGGDGDAPVAVDYIVGCALMIKRDAWEKAGPLDERFFLYYEETDLCARVRRAGRAVLHVPTARMWHKIGQATGGESPMTCYYMQRNRLLYLRENATAGALRAALLDSLRLMLVWIRQRKSREHRRAQAWGVWDFVRGRFGRAAHLAPPAAAGRGSGT